MAGRWAAQCRSLSLPAHPYSSLAVKLEVLPPEHSKTVLSASGPRQRRPKGSVACCTALLQPGMLSEHQSACYVFSDNQFQ